MALVHWLALIAVVALCIQEWERRYLLTKARHLHDASHDDDVIQSLAHQASSLSLSSSSAAVATPRIKATPAYLHKRVEKRQPLPKVTVAVVANGVDEGMNVREMDQASLVAVVMEYVVCGGVRGIYLWS